VVIYDFVIVNGEVGVWLYRIKKKIMGGKEDGRRWNGGWDWGEREKIW
jgi:hypothetical protein